RWRRTVSGRVGSWSSMHYARATDESAPRRRVRLRAPRRRLRVRPRARSRVGLRQLPRLRPQRRPRLRLREGRRRHAELRVERPHLVLLQRGVQEGVPLRSAALQARGDAVTNGRDPKVWRGWIALLATSAAVGLLAGLLGVGFRVLVAQLLEWVTGRNGSILEVGRALPPWARVALPTAGALVGALLLYALGRGETAFGVRDLMEVVTLRRRSIRVGPTLGRVASALATIASGGSVGREGPIMQLGATAASLVGDATRANPRSRSILLAAGAAAGMAAAYNAPLAGAVFVMEVVLSNFALDVFVPVVFASATAALVKRALLGADPLYAVSEADARLTWTLVACAIPLGIACAPLAIGF